MSSDSGFGSLVADEEQEDKIKEITKHLSPKIEPNTENFEPIHVAVVPSVEDIKAKEELQKKITSALRNDNLRPMCANGYHGCCKYTREECQCQCHKATIRKPI